MNPDRKKSSTGTRILAVDPGDRRLGLAISDPTGTLAAPLQVLPHKSRDADAAAIARIAKEQGAGRIVVGQALDSEGEPSYQGRKAARLAAALRACTDIPVELWDESGTTQAARAGQLAIGTPRRKRSGHLDDLAAVVLLQSYLEARRTAGS